MDGVLWVTQGTGGPNTNYCGNPGTGRSDAPLKLGYDASLLAVSDGSIYFVPNAASQSGQQLDEAQVNPKC
jgi:hypothetical protein